MALTVLRSGIHIPSALLAVPVIEKIKSLLTVTHVGFQQKISRQQAYFVDRKSQAVVVAHEYGQKLLAKVAPAVPVKYSISPGDDIKIGTSNLQLMTHQVLLREHLLKTKYKPHGSCILELEAGQGKTYLAMGLIQEFSKKTLVVVPNETLLEQWAEVLAKTFPTLTIGVYYAKVHTDGDIVVASIASLMTDTVSYKSGTQKIEESSIAFMARFGFTVYDEIHMFCTLKRAKIFRKSTSYRTLGLSATCFDRLDGMDPIAHYYVGDPIIAASVLETLQPDEEKQKVKFVINATQLQYNGPLEYTQTLVSDAETVSHPLMVNQFSKDPWRNQLIIDEIMQLYKNDHCVMVFLDRVELIEQLVVLLKQNVKDLAGDAIITPELLGDLDDQVKSIKGGTSKPDRKTANDTSRICIVSYQCGGTGLSMPRYTAAIFAHPRRNGFKQYIKRVCRIGGPDKTRQLVFIQDNRTSLKGQYNGFRSSALLYDATIVTRKVDYESIVLIDPKNKK